MQRFEGSEAVSNARTAIVILGCLGILVGIVLAIIGFSSGYTIEWPYVLAGISLLGLSVFSFILNAILKGVEHIAKAGEIYMDEIMKKTMEKEDNAIRLPMQGDVKTPTHI